MRRIAALFVTLLALAAPPAMAQGGLNLYWNGCSADAEHAQSMTFACDTNTGPSFALWASVIVPADMPRFAGAHAIVDVYFWYRGSVPSWWLTNSGQCRAHAISMTFAPVEIATSCPDIWGGSAIVSVFQPQLGVQGPNTLRLDGAAAIQVGQEIHVPADGAELNVGKILISRVKSTGAGACAECSSCAVLAFSQCKLQQAAGVGDYTVTQPLSGFVSWNGSCPPPDAAQNRTWGAVKGMYR